MHGTTSVRDGQAIDITHYRRPPSTVVGDLRQSAKGARRYGLEPASVKLRRNANTPSTRSCTRTRPLPTTQSVFYCRLTVITNRAWVFPCSDSSSLCHLTPNRDSRSMIRPHLVPGTTLASLSARSHSMSISQTGHVV